MKSYAEIIQGNTELIARLIGEDKNSIYWYLKNSEAPFTDFSKTATAAQFLVVLNALFKIELWALQFEISLDTAHLIAFQASLLTKLHVQVLSPEDSEQLRVYHQRVDIHISQIAQGILDEVPSWHGLENNLQTSAKFSRSNAKNKLQLVQDHEALRLTNLLENQYGDINTHLAKLLSLESIGNVNARSALINYYEKLARSIYYAGDTTLEQKETELRNLALTCKVALYYLGMVLIHSGNGFLGFSITDKVKEGLKLLDDIKEENFRAYFSLANCYEQGAAIKRDSNKALHYFYIYERALKKNQSNIISEYTKKWNKSLNVLAEIYLALLEPCEGELNDFYGSAHFKNAFNISKNDFLDHAWRLSSNKDLSYEHQLQLLQLVENLSHLPKLTTESLAEIKNRLQASVIEPYEKNKMMRSSKILNPKLVAHFALVLIDDRDIDLSIRQGWILLAWQRLTKVLDATLSSQLEKLQERLNKIPVENRIKLAAELQVTLPEIPAVAQVIVPSPQLAVVSVQNDSAFFKSEATISKLKQVVPPTEEPISYPVLPQEEPKFSEESPAMRNS